MRYAHTEKRLVITIDNIHASFYYLCYHQRAGDFNNVRHALHRDILGEKLISRVVLKLL